MKKIFSIAASGLFILFLAGVTQTQPVNRVRLFDTNYSHYLTLAWNENRTANQTLNFITGAANRSITLAGDLTLTGTNKSATWEATTAFIAPYFNATSTTGSSGYGIRNNSGVMEYKNYGGAWAEIASVSPPPGAAGGWTDDGTVVRLTTSTDLVGIGTASTAYPLTVKGRTSAAGDYGYVQLDSSDRTVAEISDSGRLDLFDYSGSGSVLFLANYGTPVNAMTAGHYAFGAKNAAGNPNTTNAILATVTDITTASMDSKLYFSYMDGADTSGGWTQPNKSVELSAAGLVLPDAVPVQTTDLYVGNIGSYTGTAYLRAGTTGDYAGASLIWNMSVGGGYANSILGEIRPSSSSTTGNLLNFYVGTWNNNNAPGNPLMTLRDDGHIILSSTSGHNAFDKLVLQDEGGTTSIAIRNYLTADGGVNQYSEITGGRVSAGNSYLAFSTTGSGTLGERVRITAPGNVGIMTATPLGTLGVLGSVALTNVSWGTVSSPAEDEGFTYRASASSVYCTGIFFSNNWAEGGQSWVTIKTANGAATAERMKIDHNGTSIKGYLDFSGTPDIVSSAAAISISTAITHVVTNGAGTVLTLAAGVEGQVKFIVLKTLTSGGQTDVITPDSGGAGFTTITMDAAGDAVTLLYTNAKWHVVGSYSCTIA